VSLRADLIIPIGDSWWSPLWAVLRTGQPVDLTDGWEVRAQARSRAGDPMTFYEWNLADDHILLGTASVSLTPGALAIETSTVQMYHPGVASEEWPVWEGVYDLEIRKDDDVFTLTHGSVRTTRDVTRDVT